MKSFKLILALVTFVYASMFTANAAKNTNNGNTPNLGVPYSLEYMAKHNSKNQKLNGYDDLVVFHESGATATVYRTYTWSIQFVSQSGNPTYYFDTNDSVSNWSYLSDSDELWLGTTVSPEPGTYNIIIQNTSGVGGTYESGASFINANGQGDGVWSGDVVTGRSDIVLQNVYVDGTNKIDIVVNKTQF